MRRVAIIPARGGSKRLPRKNILAVAGKPMLHYPSNCAHESGLFEKVIVSTEDDEIAELASSSNAEVIDRAVELAGDNIPVADVCQNVLSYLADKGEMPDSFCCIYATAIFLQPDDLIESEKKLRSS